MITKRDDEQKDQRRALDMDAFEVQVDKEIDNLFVPAEMLGNPDEKPSDAPLADEMEAAIVEVAAPIASPSAFLEDEKPEKAAKGMDVDAFELQIDKEIDNLFVPADYGQTAFEQPSAASSGPTTMAPINGGANGGHVDASVEMTQSKLEIEKPIESKTVEIPAEELLFQFEESSARPEVEKPAPQKARESELPSLVENFNIAYLSLDWEFSSENLTRLWTALENLKSYCDKSRETLFLFKLLRSLVHRLRSKPDSVQPEIIEVIRDAHEALRALLLSEGGPGVKEKDRIKSLVSRYKILRDSTLERRDDQSEISHVEPPSPFNSHRDELPLDRSSMTLSGLAQWMEACSREDKEAVKVFENQALQLRQIEDSLRKTPSLANLSSQIAGARLTLEQYASFCAKREQDRAANVEWLRDLKGRKQEDEAGAASTDSFAESVTRVEASEIIPAAKEPPTHSGETRHDQVFSFSLGGKQYAILAKHVVKIDKANAKKAEKILDRGYAALSDFKPFFRSVKAGLMGAWSGLPSEILKTHHFMPMPPTLFGMEEISPSVNGAILVSSGRNHGVIFVDSPAVELHNDSEILITKGGQENVLGTIRGDSGYSIEVLNMDRMLRKLREETNQDV